MVDIKENAQADRARIFPPYLLWFVLVPALPFFFSISALSFFVNPSAATQEYFAKSKPAEKINIDKQLAVNPHCANPGNPECISGKAFIQNIFSSKINYIENPKKILTHISNLLTYFSITAVHGIVCLFVIGFFIYQTHKLPIIIVRRTYLYMAITSIAFFAAAFIVHKSANELMLTQLGYKSICVMLSQADLQTALVLLDPNGGHTGEACFRAEYTRLVWLAYTPIMFGVLAIIFASTFATVMASQAMPSPEEQWRPYFLSRIKLLQKSFYLLSLVLVTSTITILLFTSLPAELLDTKGSLVTAFGKFVNGITAFWGGLFTATLFATFVPAALLLLNHTRHHQSEAASSSELGQWLYDSVFVSIKKQTMNALVIIAPMLVGPFSELLRNLSGISG